VGRIVLLYTFQYIILLRGQVPYASGVLQFIIDTTVVDSMLELAYYCTGETMNCKT
jgi:hypothetical protein